MKEQELTKMYERVKDGRYYRAMIHDSPVAILLSDMTGAFVDANDAALKFFGYTKDELLSMRFQQVTSREDMILSMEMLNTLHKGNNHFEMVKRYVTKTGSLVWAAVKVNVIRSDNGDMEMHVIHIIPLLGCTDDVIRDVVGRMGKCDKIVISKSSFVVTVAIVIIVEALIHLMLR